MEVIWSDQSDEDLVNIYNFLNNLNEDAAERHYRLLMDETRRLGKSPLRWPILEETKHHKNPIRAVVVAKGRYKIFYRVDTKSKAVLIIRIWDCRQDPCRLNLNRWCEA